MVTILQVLLYWLWEQNGHVLLLRVKYTVKGILKSLHFYFYFMHNNMSRGPVLEVCPLCPCKASSLINFGLKVYTINCDWEISNTSTSWRNYIHRKSSIYKRPIHINKSFGTEFMDLILFCLHWKRASWGESWTSYCAFWSHQVAPHVLFFKPRVLPHFKMSLAQFVM